jgi:hypothetical protein
MNKYQEIANEAYPDCCIESAMTDPNYNGDMLARHIGIELSDDAECYGVDCAIGRLETARDELQAVINALAKARDAGQLTTR